VRLSPNATTGAQFFGFTDSGASISSVTLNEAGPFTSARDLWAVDDVVYSTTVPEPATLSLLGLGLAAIARRRFAKK